MIGLFLLAVSLFLLDDLTTYKIAKDFPECIEEESNREARELMKIYGPIGVFYGWKGVVWNVLLFMLLVLALRLFWYPFDVALKMALSGFCMIKLYAVVSNIHYYLKRRCKHG